MHQQSVALQSTENDEVIGNQIFAQRIIQKSEQKSQESERKPSYNVEQNALQIHRI
jgi:hypothetical protein